MNVNRHEYYRSHHMLPFLTGDAQTKIDTARVVVIGAGGLGCPSLQYLAGAGVGRLTIIDGDTVSLSNLQRQLLFTTDDVGKPKAAIAARECALINPFIAVEYRQDFVTPDNIEQHLASATLVIDATDNFSTRYLVSDTTASLGIPLVYGAIHQGEGQVTVFNHKNGPALRDLFPFEDNTVVASCADIGAFNMTTGVIGLLMATETIKVIIDHPAVLSGKLLEVDLLQNEYRSFRFHKQYQTSAKHVDTGLYIDAKILKDKIKQDSSLLLLDVRSNEEHARQHLGGLHSPIDNLLLQTDFDEWKHKTVIAYCESGARSLRAARHLREHGITAFSLYGGLRLFNTN